MVPYFKKTPKDIREVIDASPLYKHNPHGYYSVCWENNTIHGYAHIDEARRAVSYLEKFGDPILRP